MAARGLRTRQLPASSSPQQQTSNRSGLRNSGLSDPDQHLSLPPAKRRRLSSDGQDQQTVHVSATSPNLVIAGIRPNQWPFSTSPLPHPNGRKRARSPDASLSDRRTLSRPKAPTSRSPLKRRAVRDESYAEVNTDEDFLDDDSEGPLPPSTAVESRRSSQAQDTQDSSRSSGPSIAVHAADDKLSHQDELNADMAPFSTRLDTTEQNVNKSNAEDRVAGAAALTSSGDAVPKSASRDITPAAGPPDEAGSEAAANHEGAPETAESKPATLPDELPDELPGPFLQRQSTPTSLPDEAARIFHRQFDPMTNPTFFTDLLNSHPPENRSTETLWRLASATQKVLVAWQDEYLSLDAKTAPAQHPPKKPATGGRQPLEHRLAENAKEIDLWGHILGVEGIEYPATKRGAYAGLGYDTPTSARPAASTAIDTSEGRRARRRGADARLTDGVQLSETEAGRTDKRARKPVRRFDAGSNSLTGRKRRRAANTGEGDSESEFVDDAEQPGPRKRGRLTQIQEEDAWDASGISAGEDEASDRASLPPSTRGGTGRGRGGRGRGGRARGQSRAGNRQVQSELAPASAAAQPASVAVQPASVGSQQGNDDATQPRKQQKAKSEKRSSSMTAWWAERKRKKNEERMKAMQENGPAIEYTNGTPVPPATATPAMQVAPQPARTSNPGNDYTRSITEPTMRPVLEQGPPAAPPPAHHQQPAQPMHPQAVPYPPAYHPMHAAPPPLGGPYHPSPGSHMAPPPPHGAYRDYPQQGWYPPGYPGAPAPGSAYPRQPAPAPPHMVPHAEYRMMNAR